MPLVLAAGQPQMIQSQESASDKLLKLAQLRDAGVLTDDEFQAKRAALINLI
jgi:Short C-terminal domain